MHHEEHDASNDDWSAEERSRLANLSMEREPSALLRPRTVAALRDAGLLASADVAPDHVRLRRRSVARGLALVVAASLLFMAGGAVGYRVAVRRFTARPNADAVRIATEVVPAATTAPATDRHVVWF